MGLAEERAICKVQEERIPGVIHRIDRLFDGPVPLEVDWGSFQEMKAIEMAAWINGNYSIVMTPLEEIGGDAVGKDVLRTAIRTIRVVNVTDQSQERFTIEGGVYEHRFHWATLEERGQRSVVDEVQRFVDAVFYTPKDGTLGLAERRGIRKVQDQIIPYVIQRIQRLFGDEVALEIDWNSFREMKAIETAMWMNSNFSVLLSPLEEIGHRAAGRDALRAAVRRIHVV